MVQLRSTARGGGEPHDIGPERGAEQLLESFVLQHARLREEREDPAAVVVDDHDPQIDATTAERDQGIGVVDERKITDQHEPGRTLAAPEHGASGVPQRTPSAVDTTPSIPFAPRLL